MGAMSEVAAGRPHEEPHLASTGSRLNWLRAGVLGANDGIVSTAGVIVGVAGASSTRGPVLTAGLAALVAGALSMAVGEYVSVSTQRDTERAMIAKELGELRDTPHEELDELAGFYVERGLEPALAHEVAVQLTARDALAAHAEVELKIDPEQLTNPWTAAFASMGSFLVGALIPMAAVVLSSHSWLVPMVMVAVVLALALTGVVSGRLGQMSRALVGRQVLRNVGGGLVAMIVTYAVGLLVGTRL